MNEQKQYVCPWCGGKDVVEREPAKIVSKEWKLTIVFLRGLNVVSPDSKR